MLDSSGSKTKREISCFLCSAEKLKLEIYTPHYGHCGEELKNYPSSISKFENQAGWRLFETEVDKTNRTILLVETVFRPSLMPYHHGDCVLPDFGESIGQTICVCPCCIAKREVGSASWKIELYQIFMEKFNDRYFRLLGKLFWRGVIPNKLVQKNVNNRLRRTKKDNELKELKQMVDQMMSELIATKSTRGAKLLRPAHRALESAK